ncbi:uncharacterized protein LOC110860452 isoform X2 [Folsomia candida]|nr:uncharacterized protein LOC110860452 isoform X2 [Folsomia candida]
MISGLTTSIQLSVARNVMNGCILRCISLNVDLNNERRRFCFLECMNYLFYFPLLLSGPFVSFCTFTSQVRIPYINYTGINEMLPLFIIQMYENRNRNTHTCIELATCVLVSLVLLLIPYCAYADIYTYAPTNLYFLTIWQLGGFVVLRSQTFILLQAIILHLPTIRASGDGLILYPVTCKIPYLSLAPSHASKIVDPGFHLFLRKTTGCDLLDSFWYPVLRGVLPSKTGIDFVGKEILSISCASKSTRKPFDVLPEGLAVVTETEPVWELEASITLTQISDIFSHKNKDIETLLLNYLPWSWIQDLIPTARSPSDITVGIYSSERAKVKIETNVPLLREVDLALSSIQECYAKNPTVYNNIADMIGTDGIRSSDMHQLRFTKID